MRFLAAIPALILAGCAALVPGTSRESDVIARFGTPVEQRQLPDGTRLLDYPRQPMGYENYRVVLAPDGTVKAVQQLLDEPYFARLRAGMSKDEVHRELGLHAETMRFSNLREEVWSWRYMEPNRRMFFNAHFDFDGRFKYSSRTEDFVADHDEMN